MVLYFSDNKETEHKRKGVFYEETLPENAVIFGSTTLKKYNGGPADYMKVGAKRYYIDEPVSERDVIGYIPVVAERYPSAPSETIDQTENKYGYIQVKECYPFLPYILPILLLLILLVLIVRSVGGSGLFKNNVVLPDKHEQPSVSIENKETIKEPDKNQNPIQPTASTKEPEKKEKNTSVAVLPIDPIIVPGNKLAAKPVSIITPTATPSPEPESTALKPTDTSDDSITPAPTTTPHVHTYVVEEQAATCTDLGFYKKYCSECGYVVANHTCTALGHTNSVASVSNMTYPDGMTATYVCDRCNETVKDNFDYTAGLYKADGSLLYTYDALEQVFDWNLSTTPVKEQMDTHTELADGRILVLPSWSHLSEVAAESGKTSGLSGDNNDEPVFNECLLTEVVLPDDTPYLGFWFYNCNIEKLSLPDSITEYKGNVSNNNNLHYLKLSANTKIVSNFYSNYNLWAIIIPEGVTELKGYTFSNINKNEEHPLDITLPNSITNFNSSFANSHIRTLTIPGTVKVLPTMTSWIFEKLVLEEGVEEIPDYFYSKQNSPLVELIAPSTLKKIGDSAFMFSGLEEIYWRNCSVEFGSNIFQECNDLKNLYIPDNTKEITSFLISGNSNMKTQSVVFPEEVDLFGRPSGPIIQIRNGNDSGIVGHVIMPSKINKFVTDSSSNIIWDTLEEIVLPGGDYSGIYGLFQSCDKLKEITFTSELTGMSKHFFTYIPSVTDIYYYGSEKSINTLIDEYNAIKTDSDPANLFGNATIHYMTGNPPTREELMKKYGIWGDYHEHVIDAPTEDDTEADTVSFNIDAIFPVVFNAKVELSATEHTHTISIDEKAPTCTEDGYYRVTCSACGEVLADHVCKKLGHNMQMIDPEDNTADIMVPRFKCNRCDYTECTNHTHNWIAKGYENMTYPNGGDAVYVCTTCLNKKKEHCDAVPGIYYEAGALMYTYNELEKLFQWDLSVHNAKYYSDNNVELSSGKILKLPTWEYLTKKAEASGNNAILINGGFHNSATCAFNESTFTNIIFPEDIPYLDMSWFGYLKNLQVLEIPNSVKEYTCSNGTPMNITTNLRYLKFSANADITNDMSFNNNINLETVIFPNGIKAINGGGPLFYGSGIKEIQFPSTLSKLNCNILIGLPVEELIIPTSVELNSTNGNSISVLPNLKKLTLMNVKEKFSNNASFIRDCPLLETLVIQGDYGISDSFIAGCNNLKTVVFSGNISYINENAFAGCALEDVYYIGNDEASKQVIANAANGPFANVTIHYMNEEATTQSITSEVPAAEETSLPAVVSLPVTEETTDTNSSESTGNVEETKPLQSVSDGDAK